MMEAWAGASVQESARVCMFYMISEAFGAVDFPCGPQEVVTFDYLHLSWSM